jgi:hypothetical protein
MGKVQRTIARYSSYYHGWCIAFGEHDIRYDEDLTINWVESESQMGFVVSADKTKPLYRELLRYRDEVPIVDISEFRTRINELEYEFSNKELYGAKKFIEYVQRHKVLHMFLTSHFCYPPRTRIVTFSPKKPSIILYKEISPIKLILS